MLAKFREISKKDFKKRFSHFSFRQLKMSLDADTITTIHATVPALEAYGTEIIDVFYTIVFTEYPQLKGVFNMSHQRPTSDHPNGAQRQALKQAVIAYAKNIHQLEALLPSVYIITQKHVSVGVLPEHYPIVGKTLLRAIKQVLQDAATPDIMTVNIEYNMYKKINGHYLKERIF